MNHVAKATNISPCRANQSFTIEQNGRKISQRFDANGKSLTSFVPKCGDNSVQYIYADGTIVSERGFRVECDNQIRIYVDWAANRNIELQVLEPPREGDARALWVHASQRNGDDGKSIGTMIKVCSGDADCPGQKQELYQAPIAPSWKLRGSTISAYAAVCDPKPDPVAKVRLTIEISGRVVDRSEHTVSSRQCAPRPEDDTRLRDRIGGTPVR